MPALMQLQGPSLNGRSNLGYIMSQNVTPPLAGLQGAGLAAIMNPIIFLGGLAIGGYLAYRNVHPFRFIYGKAASIWGGHRMSQSRAKALSGRRRR